MTSSPDDIPEILMPQRWQTNAAVRTYENRRVKRSHSTRPARREFR